VSTLTLNISDSLKKKLGALAILSGKTYDTLEGELSDYLEQLITDQIAGHLGMTSVPQTYIEEDKPTGRQPVVETEVIIEDLAGHALSGDEDTGDTKSLQEQYEEEAAQPKAPTKKPTKAAPIDKDNIAAFLPNIRVPLVGNDGEDAEAFLDQALGQPAEQQEYGSAGYGGVGMRGHRPRAITKAFNPRNRQAKVSEYTGANTSEWRTSF
jgi:hypothetical protein